MAELSPVFLDGLTYPAKEDRKLLKDLFTEGILTSGALAVTQHSTPAMSVDVALGRAIITNDAGNFGNYIIENDALVTKTIAASDRSNGRIDRIIAQVYDATDISGTVNSWALEVLTGTPAASPAAPALPSNALDIALVAVAAGVTTIINANITDQRTITAIPAALLSNAPVTLTNTVTLTNKTLTKPVINGTNPTGAAYTPATGAQTVALDCAANNMHIVTGHASGTAITFTVANVTNNQPFIVSILQGAVVSTITAWFATVRWPDGTTPTLTATVGKRDTFGFIRTGANTYDGFIVGQNI